MVFDQDGTPECIIAFTDGSQLEGKAGQGVWYEPDTAFKDFICGRVPGDQSNNSAELQAILRCVRNCRYESRPLRIQSDSAYAIQTLSMYASRQQMTGADDRQVKLKNLELIKVVVKHLMDRREKGMQLSKVKAHSGVFGNECADWLANAGRECGISVIPDESELSDD